MLEWKKFRYVYFLKECLKIFLNPFSISIFFFHLISGPYSSGIVEDGLDHLLQNPEFQLRSTLLEPRLLKQQTDELRHITLQLKSAHTGLDVEWWNEVNRIILSYGFLFYLYSL